MWVIIRRRKDAPGDGFWEVLSTHVFEDWDYVRFHMRDDIRRDKEGLYDYKLMKLSEESLEY